MARQSGWQNRRRLSAPHDEPEPPLILRLRNWAGDVVLGLKLLLVSDWK